MRRKRKNFIYKKYYCKDCQNSISYQSALYGLGRCIFCAGKGKNNNNYKHGLSNTKKYIKSYRRKTNLKKFGLTKKDYNHLLKKQNYRCAICECSKDKFKRRLAVDHNHKTNQIRGLLCLHCNNGLGHFRDSIKLLENAINYLLKYKRQNGTSLK